VFQMWNNPEPAPEYRLEWVDKDVVKKGLEKILCREFDRIIIAHGNLIDTNANAAAAHLIKPPGSRLVGSRAFTAGCGYYLPRFCCSWSRRSLAVRSSSAAFFSR